MRSLLIIGIAFLIFSGCKGKNKPPKGVLPQGQMSSVLWDMFQAQGWAQQEVLKDSLLSVAVETKTLSNKVLEMHGLSEKDFQKSYNWYLKHPDIFKIMLDSIYAQKSRINGPLLRDEHGSPNIKKPMSNLQEE